MAQRLGFFLASLVILSCFTQISSETITLFSSLKKTIIVTATPKPGQELKAGEDKFTVTWSMNKTAGSDSDYKTVKVKLCYAPVSQKDRGWRKTKDDLKKDKTCQHKIVARPYNSANKVESFEYTVQRDVPQATYFVRAYVYNAAGDAVAFGQTTDVNKTSNLFVVNAVSGRHMSMDIASVCFSAFSVLSLAGFFIAEKRSAKNK